MSSSTSNNIGTSTSVKRPREELSGHLFKSSPRTPGLVNPITFDIDNSHIKKITIGLRLMDDLDSTPPVVKFHGRDTTAIFMTANEWIAFKNEIIVIDAWFDETLDLQDLTVNPFGHHKIKCTTVYNKKAIILEYSGQNESHCIDGEKSSKKPKTPYSSMITLQKASYDGLKSLIPCIDHQLKVISRRQPILQECTQTLIDVIRQTSILEAWDVTKCMKGKVRTVGLDYADTELDHSGREGAAWTWLGVTEEDNSEKRAGFLIEIICLHFDFIYQKIVENI